MGMINVADGICAIDKLVFKDKKYTVDTVNEAIRQNFEGYGELRDDLLSCAKFGQDSYADEYAVRLAEILQGLIRAHDSENMFFSPSLHTLDANVKYGSNWGAGYDGRRRGEPFAKNGGASNYARNKTPTALIMSAAKLPQHKLYGGQPIDISFDPHTVRDHKKEISALIGVYLKNGGLQVQVNAVSSVLLRDALEQPDRYPDLIVRIGGYSTYFSSLSVNSKKEFIERFEKEGH
jgi:formate C-acetyltransferase